MKLECSASFRGQTNVRLQSNKHSLALKRTFARAQTNVRLQSNNANRIGLISRIRADHSTKAYFWGRKMHWITTRNLGEP